MTEGRQSLAGAYAKIESHEDLCAERYGRIHDSVGGLRDSIGDLRNLMKAILGGIVAVVLGLLAWLAIQLYTLEPLRVAAATRQSTISVSVDPSAPGSSQVIRRVR